jgi:hypothetical protein
VKVKLDLTMLGVTMWIVCVDCFHLNEKKPVAESGGCNSEPSFFMKIREYVNPVE